MLGSAGGRLPAARGGPRGASSGPGRARARRRRGPPARGLPRPRTSRPARPRRAGPSSAPRRALRPARRSRDDRERRPRAGGGIRRTPPLPAAPTEPRGARPASRSRSRPTCTSAWATGIRYGSTPSRGPEPGFGTHRLVSRGRAPSSGPTCPDWSRVSRARSSRSIPARRAGVVHEARRRPRQGPAPRTRACPGRTARP